MDQHRRPFNLDPDFIKKWVVPFYMDLLSPSRHEENLLSATREVWATLSEDVVGRLLDSPEWRSRSTGAYFAALKGFASQRFKIEQLLLASELVYADRTLCLGIAMLKNQESAKCLLYYIEEMTDSPSGHQHIGDALGALEYLDELNSTQLAASLPMDLMESFKGQADLFHRNLTSLFRIKESLPS